jgi:hypothetical protein
MKEEIMMRVLKKILFTFALSVGMTLAVSAQKNGDQQKPPPKQPPPVINPGDKKPPPKSEDRPKKPAFALLARKADEAETA